MTELPILYSFRRCPYAMRARMALVYAGISCHLREVKLSDKPSELLEVSPKGTVPVLSLPDGTVIEESLDIIRYAVGQHDPDGWADVTPEEQATIDPLIHCNDTEFAPLLTRYKYHVRYPEHPQAYYLQKLEQDFLQPLEARLIAHRYLIRERKTIADIALFPLIRQFSMVDEEWFRASSYAKLRHWLNGFLESNDFSQVMKKYAPWRAGDTELTFPPL